jgi:hypothetical protein
MYYNKYNLWFFIKKELSDITAILQQSLDLPEYYRDYENTWEWCESNNRSKGIYFDIAREHNWKHGIYTCPVILSVRKDGDEYSQCEIVNVAKVIAKELNVVVYYGEVTYLENSNYKYDIIMEIDNT